jgi:hypothetical protein
MSLVWDSVTQLKKVQIDDGMIEELRAGIADSRKLLYAKRTALFEQMSITLDLIERTQQVESKYKACLFLLNKERRQEENKMEHVITTYGGGELFILVFDAIAALFKADRTGMVMSLMRVGLMVGSVYVLMLMFFKSSLARREQMVRYGLFSQQIFSFCPKQRSGLMIL